MGRSRNEAHQGKLYVTWDELPRSPGHVFYDKLQKGLIKSGFDAFAEAHCAPRYAEHRGRPSIPPVRYFRMHLIGYFESINSERGIEWRCADSLSLREFLRLSIDERVPNHSTLSRIRSRLPLEVHKKVFQWVLSAVAQTGLVNGKSIGVDASTMETNAAMRHIVRRDAGDNYRKMLIKMTRESGVETPSTEDFIRIDRARKDKKVSNKDWKSPVDADARIAKMKDGTTHLAYKPEHAVDLCSGAIVAAVIHPADFGDTACMPITLQHAENNLKTIKK